MGSCNVKYISKETGISIILKELSVCTEEDIINILNLLVGDKTLTTYLIGPEELDSSQYTE